MRTLKLLTACLLLLAQAYAGTVSGSIQTATGGAIANGTLTFTLSQAAIASGLGSVATQSVSCYTSNSGNIVGVPDPLVLPVTSTNYASGTLAAGTYYVQITYWNGSGESAPSSERIITLTSQGTLQVSAPVNQPTAASGYKVYIGATSGAEKLQGSVTGWGNWLQNAALAAGQSAPAANNSACQVYFSDELVPSGTYYTVSLLSARGTSVAGYPQTWCTYGGSSGVINVSLGTPTGNCGTNGVNYPTPIMAVPPSNSPQSISGPLDLGNFAFTAAQVNAQRVVSPTNSQRWSGSDVGAWINSAAASCPAATYIGALGVLSGQACEIYIAAGAYTRSTPIQYVNGLRIHGAGMGATVITSSAATNNSMVLMGVNAAENGLPASVLGYMELSDLTLDGNAANQSGTSYCVHMGRAGRVSIHDLQYQNCRNGGIVWDNGNNAAQGAITTTGSDGLGVVVTDHVFGLGPQIGGSNSDGIFDWGGNDFRITRNDYNALNASGNRYGVWIRDAGNVSLENSWVSSSTNYGVYVENSAKVRITSDFIDSSSVQGLFVGDSGPFSSQVTITANHVTNSKSAVPQIEIGGCIGCRLTGNVAAGGLGTYGLQIDNIANNSDITEEQNVWNGNATGTIADAQNRLLISNPYGSSKRVNRVDLTAQGANISNTALFNTNAAIPGFYRVSCSAVVTRAATTSSTLPNCQVNYTDADSGIAQTVSITNAPTTNTIGTTGLLAGQYYGHVVIHAAASTAINYATANYASVGATSMQYAVHVQVEYLGN